MLPGALAERFAAVVRTVDLTAIIDKIDEPKQRFAMLRAIGEMAGTLAPNEASDWILNGLVRLAGVWLADATASSFADSLYELVEAGARAAKSYDDNGPARFGAYMRALLSMCPQAAGKVREVLDTLVLVTPAAEARSFWDALLTARAC